MTKEEILEKYSHNYRKYQDRNYGSMYDVWFRGTEVNAIMDEYAQQQCLEKDREIAELKQYIQNDVKAAIKVLSNILHNIRLDLGAEAAKRMLHDIDQLNNKEVNSQEKPIL